MTRAALTQIKDGSAENYLWFPFAGLLGKPRQGRTVGCADHAATLFSLPVRSGPHVALRKRPLLGRQGRFPKQDRTSSAFRIGVPGVCPYDSIGVGASRHSPFDACSISTLSFGKLASGPGGGLSRGPVATMWGGPIK